MAPFCAQAKAAAAPSTRDKKTALGSKPEPIVLRNQRDAFKISSSQSHPYIVLNPEAAEKLYRMFQIPGHQRGRHPRQTIMVFEAHNQLGLSKPPGATALKDLLR